MVFPYIYSFYIFNIININIFIFYNSFITKNINKNENIYNITHHINNQLYIYI